MKCIEDGASFDKSKRAIDLLLRSLLQSDSEVNGPKTDLSSLRADFMSYIGDLVSGAASRSSSRRRGTEERTLRPLWEAASRRNINTRPDSRRREIDEGTLNELREGLRRGGAVSRFDLRIQESTEVVAKEKKMGFKRGGCFTPRQQAGSSWRAPPQSGRWRRRNMGGDSAKAKTLMQHNLLSCDAADQQGRNLFSSQKGYQGVGPFDNNKDDKKRSAVKVGDHIVFIPTVGHPLILRPRPNDTYKFIGPAFIPSVEDAPCFTEGRVIEVDRILIR